MSTLENNVNQLEKKGPKTALSLIRATGRTHLGNYLGALYHFVKLNQKPEMHCVFGVATLHSLTTVTDPNALRRDINGIVVDFLAAGLDPERSMIFDQNAIPETLQLSWILSCLASAGRLERMHHWKEKKDKLEEFGQAANVGLFSYPVLMAADILGPGADIVPVGEDQIQHVEFARELARRFNHLYGDYFQIPEVLEREAIRVPGLSTSGKMGKSEGEAATIYLSDSYDANLKKIKVAPTDPARVKLQDPGNPALCNIGGIHRILSQMGLHEENIMDWVNDGCSNAKMGCFTCKKKLLDEMEARFLKDFREKRAEILSKGDRYILDVIEAGNQRARARIKPIVEGAMDRVGLRIYR
jgi:tryptophanyl-tRNA synthetase